MQFLTHEELNRATAESSQEPPPEPWPDPTPIDQHKVPPFPIEIFPTWLGRYVKAVAVATQTPPDLPGMVVLGVISLALARRLRIKIHPSWSEPLNLYLVVVLAPGNRKSAVFQEATRPVLEYENYAARQMAPDIERARAQQAILKARLAELSKKASKAPREQQEELMRQAEDAALELANFEVPVSPRLFADDVTVEKLVSLVQAHGGRMAVLSAEGGIFQIAGGRYSRDINIEFFLKGHAGDSHRVDRMNRASESIDRPALTLVLTVQPGVIQGLVKHQDFRSLGLLARFLYSLPVSTVGLRMIDPPALPRELAEAYRMNIRRLLELEFERDPQGHYIERELMVGRDARVLLNDFSTWLEPQLGTSGALANIADWAGKLAGAVARIAGILHMADHAHENFGKFGVVSADTMRRAITLGHYLIEHAKAAHAEMGADPDVDEARYLLEHLTQLGQPMVSKRDLHRVTRGRFKTVRDLAPALGLLVDHGYLVPFDDQRGGPGRRSEFYSVHPSLRREEPATAAAAGDFVHSVHELQGAPAVAGNFVHSVQPKRVDPDDMPDDPQPTEPEQGEFELTS